MIRKSLKRFAAVLCAAVTMVSFSSTRVEAADGDGYWTTYKIGELWGTRRQYVHNRIEKVGGAGYTARAKVTLQFYEHELTCYVATVRFIYNLENGVEYSDDVKQNYRYLVPGHTFEFDFYQGGVNGHRYWAIRPRYGAGLGRFDYPIEHEGMFRIEY